MTHTQHTNHLHTLRLAYDDALMVERANDVRTMTNGYRYTASEWAYTRRVREATVQARHALERAEDALAAREAAYGVGVTL